MCCSPPAFFEEMVSNWRQPRFCSTSLVSVSLIPIVKFCSSEWTPPPPYTLQSANSLSCSFGPIPLHSAVRRCPSNSDMTPSNNSAWFHRSFVHVLVTTICWRHHTSQDRPLPLTCNTARDPFWPKWFSTQYLLFLLSAPFPNHLLVFTLQYPNYWSGSLVFKGLPSTPLPSLLMSPSLIPNPRSSSFHEG